LRRAVTSWLEKKKARDYVSVQAYLDPSPEHAAKLESLGAALQERLGAAITLGFGPRFLHSTGQLHKGGANTVMVLQIVDEPAADLAVAETNYTFDALIRAQALGDYLALKQRRRRLLRVNLGGDSASGLAQLTEILQS
jgi:transaldolase / glucose-6-phosphate isomerase